jgi:hypothetical protein
MISPGENKDFAVEVGLASGHASTKTVNTTRTVVTSPTIPNHHSPRSVGSDSPTTLQPSRSEMVNLAVLSGSISFDSLRIGDGVTYELDLPRIALSGRAIVLVLLFGVSQEHPYHVVHSTTPHGFFHSDVVRLQKIYTEVFASMARHTPASYTILPLKGSLNVGHLKGNLVELMQLVSNKADWLPPYPKDRFVTFHSKTPPLSFYSPREPSPRGGGF